MPGSRFHGDAPDPGLAPGVWGVGGSRVSDGRGSVRRGGRGGGRQDRVQGGGGSVRGGLVGSVVDSGGELSGQGGDLAFEGGQERGGGVDRGALSGDRVE